MQDYSGGIICSFELCTNAVCCRLCRSSLAIRWCVCVCYEDAVVFMLWTIRFKYSKLAVAFPSVGTIDEEPTLQVKCGNYINGPMNQRHERSVITYTDRLLEGLCNWILWASVGDPWYTVDVANDSRKRRAFNWEGYESISGSNYRIFVVDLITFLGDRPVVIVIIILD